MNSLLDLPEPWEGHWQGMPEFVQDDLTPWKSVMVNFRDQAALDDFCRLVGQGIPARKTRETQCIWHPKAEIGRIANKRYVADSPVNPRHPVYVISKGRWESRLTGKALDKAGIPYSMVVEPQEHGNYASAMDPGKLLVLPFSNLGQGSIPARNWVWEHALSRGAERHWILDDNIDGFYRLNHNLKVRVETGATFLAAEDFVDRYENVAIAGFHYFMFASRKSKMPPFTLNSRVYSCILIRNDLPYRWRGRYNEDTDLSLRALKDGWCTVLFLAFLALKQTTMTMRGGNTDELYQGDGRLAMAESLREQHPELAKVTRKWGRFQHHVDYSCFRPLDYAGFERNRLVRKPGAAAAPGVDNYGMRLEVYDG